jgi:hypothetical protein
VLHFFGDSVSAIVASTPNTPGSNREIPKELFGAAKVGGYGDITNQFPGLFSEPGFIPEAGWLPV